MKLAEFYAALVNVHRTHSWPAWLSDTHKQELIAEGWAVQCDDGTVNLTSLGEMEIEEDEE